MNEGLYEEAGDMEPIGGIPDRRQRKRREEDDEAEIARTIAHLFLHRGKLMAVVSTIVGFLTWFFTSLGYRYVGPRDDLRALDQKFTARDSLMAIRVTRLEDRQDEIMNRIAQFEEQLRFVVFLQCASMRQTNPNLAIDGCPAKRP